MPQRRALIIIITIMSLLIVIAMGLVAYGLTRDRGITTASTDIAPLILPKKSVIKHMAPFEDALALHVKAGKEESIYLIDPKTSMIKKHISIQYEK